LRNIVFKHNLQEIHGADVHAVLMKTVNLMSEAAESGAGVSQAPRWYRNTFIAGITCVSLALIAVCCSSCLLQFLTDHISWRTEIETCDSANMLLHQRAAQQEYSTSEPMTFAYPLGTAMLLQAKTGNKTPCRVIGPLCCALVR